MEQKRYNAPELLAPVGDMERLISAVRYGADAVYLAGKSFGMRSAPSNFTNEELEEAVKYCHAQGVKVYVTCNILPHNAELAALPAFLEFCQAIGVDAFIMTDLGVMAMAKKYAPNVAIHISTQAGVVNYETANAFYNMGAERVVLAPSSRLKKSRRSARKRRRRSKSKHLCTVRCAFRSQAAACFQTT